MNPTKEHIEAVTQLGSVQEVARRHGWSEGNTPLAVFLDNALSNAAQARTKAIEAALEVCEKTQQTAVAMFPVGSPYVGVAMSAVNLCHANIKSLLEEPENGAHITLTRSFQAASAYGCPPPWTEPSAFDVVLDRISPGAQAQVVKLLRTRFPTQSLGETLKWVKQLPTTVATYVSRPEAEELVALIQAAGGHARMVGIS